MRAHSYHLTFPYRSMSVSVPRKVHPTMQLLKPRIPGLSEDVTVRDGDLTIGQHLGGRHCDLVGSRAIAFGRSRLDCTALGPASPQSWQVLSFRAEQRHKRSRSVSPTYTVMSFPYSGSYEALDRDHSLLMKKYSRIWGNTWTSSRACGALFTLLCKMPFPRYHFMTA
jgi:hypothetical protein